MKAKKQSFLLASVVAGFGIFGGKELCNYFFWKPERMNQIIEKCEKEYWKINGTFILILRFWIRLT
jgi:hypothetical protein